jgi:hypothetical protein
MAAVLACCLGEPGPLRAQDLPGLTDEVLARMEAVLHVDVQTGRVAEVTRSGPVAEIGAKIVEVLFGDYTSGEWLSYAKQIEGEYVKPAVSARLVLLGREGGGVVLDQEFSPARRDALSLRITEYRRKAELLTAERHVPDYLLRSASNALLYVEIRKTAPYDRGNGNISATHTATVRAVDQYWNVVNTVTDRELWWSVVIHLVFVSSSVLLALSDWIAASTSHAEPTRQARAAGCMGSSSDANGSGPLVS